MIMESWFLVGLIMALLYAIGCIKVNEKIEFGDYVYGFVLLLGGYLSAYAVLLGIIYLYGTPKD